MSNSMTDYVTKSVFGSTSSGSTGLVGAMDATLDPTKGIGEKGAVEYSYSKILENASSSTESFQKSLMALSNSAIQGTKYAPFSPDVVKTNLDAVIKSLPTSGSDRKIALGLVASLLFQTRDCRKEGKGKGARDPFNFMFSYLVKNVPEFSESMKPLLALTPDYGYWKDIVSIWSGTTEGEPLYQACLDLFAHQLLDDQATLTTSGDGKKKISLAGKWAPSEGKKHGKMAKALAFNLFKTGNFSQKMKGYRSLLSTLREKIGVTETLMCAKKFSEIKFELVPGLCLNRHRLAWDNKTKAGAIRSDDADRIQAKENYHKFLESLTKPTSKGAKGTSVFLHNLAKQILGTTDPTQLALLEAQWMDHEKLILEHSKKTGCGLESILCVADVSGSMHGDPMMLAIALSVMIARLQTGIWKGRILTFHEKPSWVILQDDWSVKKCIDTVRCAPWGGTTNFVGTHQLILDVMKKNHLSASDLPSALMVVSDMQFDQANGQIRDWSKVNPSTWMTTHDTLQKMYSVEGYSLPLMIYWNARGDTNGMPVTEKEEGALMVSGFSTSLLKLFLEDGMDALMEFTPWKLLMKTLTDEHYKPVWDVML